MASGYGIEMWCTDTLRTGRYARRAMVLAQALFRRVITPRGMLRAESSTTSAADEARIYGIDLAGMVGQVAYEDLPEFVASTLRAEFLKDLGLEEPGLDRVIRAAYQLLGLQTYFTAGEKEVRAWTVRAGSTAPQAAGVIHTDFERGFIRAEVIGYGDYIAFKGESGAKEAGKLRLEGKEYIVREGDVMHFRFNV